MNKKGQFFLLAAVIISTVILTMGINPNRVVVNEEPTGFYDLGYEVKREVGAVLDYKVYTGFESDADLSEFVDLLAEDIGQSNPDSDFVLIYGDSTKVNLKDCKTTGEEDSSSSSSSSSNEICLGSACQAVSRSECKKIIQNNPGSDISVEIGESYFDFPLSDYRQVIFVMQKNVGGDRHIIVE